MALRGKATSHRTPRAGSRYGSLVQALHYRDLRVLWLSTMAHQMAQAMVVVVLAWLVLDITDSSGMLGVMYAVRSAPNMVVGFAAGSITDRLDRRSLMKIAASLQSLVCLILAALLLLDRLEIWQLLTMAFVLGALGAFFTVSRQVYTFDTVGASGLVQGLALVTFTSRVGGVVGALSGGAIIQWWSSDTAAVVMGLGYLLAAAGLLGLRYAGQAAPSVREPMGENLRRYWEALRTNRLMLSLMVAAATSEMLGFSGQVMLPILARDVLHIGAAGLGVLNAFHFVGLGLGVVVLTIIGEVRRRGVLLLVTLGCFGLSLMLLSQASNLGTAILFVTIANTAAGMTDMLHQVLFQVSVPNEQRGRAMGSWVVSVGTAPVGQMEIGQIAALTSPRTALLAHGIALIVLSLAFVVVLPRIRKLGGARPAPNDQYLVS